MGWFDPKNELYMFVPPSNYRMKTREGKKAWQEAIDVLNEDRRPKALKWAEGMAAAAQDHCDWMKANNKFSHTGEDGKGPSARLWEYGTFRGWGENLSAGMRTGKDAQLQLFIDDGVTSRGHRINILNWGSTHTGIAACEFPGYGTAMVVTFATDWVPRKP